MAKRSERRQWNHYCLARSKVYIIVHKRSREDVFVFDGGGIFTLDVTKTKSKVKGLAEGAKDPYDIGNGLYWTCHGTAYDVTLRLNAPNERIIGEIRVVACGCGEAEVFTDTNSITITSIGIYSGFALRDILSKLANALTGVYA